MTAPTHEHAETIADVRAVFEKAGYDGNHRPNKKTHGYRSPNGHVIYLSLAQTRPPWRVAIHPALPPDLARVPGIAIAAEFYHGSNVLEFPQKPHTGKRPIPYARRLIVFDLAALAEVLRRIDQAPRPHG